MVDSSKYPGESNRGNQTGNHKSGDIGDQVVQRILGRYGGLPGMLSINAMQGLARRSLFVNNQLPLLSYLQRRQAMAEGPLQPTLFNLPYARLSFWASLRSSSPQPAPPTGWRPPAHLGPPGAAPVAQLHSMAPAQTAPDPVRPPVTFKAAQPARQLQAGPGAAILHRSLNHPEEKLIQRQETSPQYRSDPPAQGQPPAGQTPPGGALGLAGFDAFRAAGSVAHSASEALPAPAPGPNKVDTTVLQRRLSRPLERATQYRSDPPAQGQPSAGQTPPGGALGLKSESVLQLSERVAYPATISAAEPPSEGEIVRLEKAILQRRLSRPAEKMLQPQDTEPGPASSNISLGCPKFDQGGIDFCAPDPLALPAPITAASLARAAVGRQVMIENSEDETVRRSAGEAEQMPGGFATAESKARPRAVLPGGPDRNGSSYRKLYPASPELPLASVSRPVGRDRAALPLIPAAPPLGPTLQRVEDPVSNNAQAPDISDTRPSPPAAPGLEELDLERLADTVYTIIERRLILERESRGL